jgi:protein-tyrosine phosphatase
MWLESGDLDPGHLTVPLSNDVPFIPGVQLNLMPVTMEDFGGVPYNWRAIVIELYRRITDGAQAHIFCHGGQGRTGTMLASLIAIGESAQSTPDPIAAVRRRYCGSAVETLAQGQAIFALRNQLLPKRYINELMLPPGAYRTRLARRTTSSA